MLTATVALWDITNDGDRATVDIPGESKEDIRLKIQDHVTVTLVNTISEHFDENHDRYNRFGITLYDVHGSMMDGDQTKTVTIDWNDGSPHEEFPVDVSVAGTQEVSRRILERESPGLVKVLTLLEDMLKTRSR